MYGCPDADAYDDLEKDTAYYAQCFLGNLRQSPDKGRLRRFHFLLGYVARL